MTRTLLRGLRFYRRVISPFTPPSCRFTPTCSSYAEQALSRHGLWRGLRLSLRRLLRCHPWGGHGFDPVPEPGESVATRPAAPPTEPTS